MAKSRKPKPRRPPKPSPPRRRQRSPRQPRHTYENTIPAQRNAPAASGGAAEDSPGAASKVTLEGIARVQRALADILERLSRGGSEGS